MRWPAKPQRGFSFLRPLGSNSNLRLAGDFKTGTPAKPGNLLLLANCFQSCRIDPVIFSSEPIIGRRGLVTDELGAHGHAQFYWRVVTDAAPLSHDKTDLHRAAG